MSFLNTSVFQFAILLFIFRDSPAFVHLVCFSAGYALGSLFGYWNAVIKEEESITYKDQG